MSTSNEPIWRPDIASLDPSLDLVAEITKLVERFGS